MILAEEMAKRVSLHGSLIYKVAQAMDNSATHFISYSQLLI